MKMKIYMLCLCQNFLSKTFEPFKLQIGDWCTGEGTDSFCSLHDGPRNNIFSTSKIAEDVTRMIFTSKIMEGCDNINFPNSGCNFLQLHVLLTIFLHPE
jgi:hypothetical protein